MTRIEVKYDDSALRKELDRLLRSGRDLEPAMLRIAGHLADSVAESFERQASPDGAAWAPLSEVTQRQRGMEGYGPERPILERRGDLALSILSEFDRDSAVAGSNLVYAATHQFGASKGAFGKTSRGGPIPWGDIPARPFLGVWPEHEELIRRTIVDHLLGEQQP